MRIDPDGVDCGVEKDGRQRYVVEAVGLLMRFQRDDFLRGFLASLLANLEEAGTTSSERSKKEVRAPWERFERDDLWDVGSMFPHHPLKFQRQVLEATKPLQLHARLGMGG